MGSVMEYYLPLVVGPVKEVEGVPLRSLFSYDSRIKGELLVPCNENIEAGLRELGAVSLEGRNETLVRVVTEWIHQTFGIELSKDEQKLVGHITDSVRPLIKRGNQ